MKSTKVKLTEEQQAELREMLERHLNLSVKIQEGGCVYEIRTDGAIVLVGCYA